MTYPSHWETAVVFANEEEALRYADDPRFEGLRRFYASNGAQPIQGRRFKKVWVHWYAFEEPRYNEVVDAIIQCYPIFKELPIPELILFV